MELSNLYVCSSSQKKTKQSLSLKIQMLYWYLDEHLAFQNTEASK